MASVWRATLARLCRCHSILGEIQQALQALVILAAGFQQHKDSPQHSRGQEPEKDIGDIYPAFFPVEVDVFLKSQRFDDARSVLQRCLNHPSRTFQGCLECVRTYAMSPNLSLVQVQDSFEDMLGVFNHAARASVGDVQALRVEQLTVLLERDVSPCEATLEGARGVSQDIARGHASGVLRLCPELLDRVRDLLFHHGSNEDSTTTLQLIWLTQLLLFYEDDELATCRVYQMLADCRKRMGSTPLEVSRCLEQAGDRKYIFLSPHIYSTSHI